MNTPRACGRPGSAAGRLRANTVQSWNGQTVAFVWTRLMIVSGLSLQPSAPLYHAAPLPHVVMATSSRFSGIYKRPDANTETQKPSCKTQNNIV